MNCNKAEKYIMKYIDGELSEKEARILNEHILMCRVCKESFYIYNTISVNIVEKLEYSAPEGFEARVMGSIALAGLPFEAEDSTHDGLIGVFSVLLGTGVLLFIFRNTIINSVSQSPYVGEMAKGLAPAADFIEANVETVNKSVSALIQNLNSVISNAEIFIFIFVLLLFGVQFVLVRRGQKK